MELFGYVCSPLCKAKADSHGIKIPIYEHQRDLVEARKWRKVLRLAGAAAGVVLLLLGVWVWFVVSGSRPKPAFSFRFPEPSYSGQSFICGKDNSQIVFLHGCVLARHDMKLKNVVWSRDLLDHKKIAAEAAEEVKKLQAAKERFEQRFGALASFGKIPSVEKVTKELERWHAAELGLFVSGSNIWVQSPTNLVRFDWDAGTSAKVISFKGRYSRVTLRGDEMVLVQRLEGTPVVTHINLATCEQRTEDFGAPVSLGTNTVVDTLGPGGLLAQNSDEATAGLPVGMPGKDDGKPMDPGKVAEEARHLPLPARIALPAVLAGNLSQERALDEMDDSSGPKKRRIKREPGESVSFVPTKSGYIQVGVKLLEQNFVEREAMKPAPAKSVLDGNLTVANTADAANEILNEMQRNRGGSTVTENLSRYRVKLQNPGDEGGWTGEIVGPPALFPLDSVYVLTANKSMIVFDKNYKKLWEAPLQFNVGRYDMSTLDTENAPNGQGPCAEYHGFLYIFDLGTLSVFDVATGKLQWRLPSVGIAGMFFDGLGNVYVNTTTANLDSIKYSRQIDLSRRDSDVVLKLDCRTGKTIWRRETSGLVNHVSGKFLYIVSYYQPDEPDEDDPYRSGAFDMNAYLKIKRLNPKTGGDMWEHYQPRAPLDIQFDKNTIRLVFKKEVQVLRYLTF